MNVAIDTHKRQKFKFYEKKILSLCNQHKKNTITNLEFLNCIYYTYFVVFECKFKKNAFNEC